MIFKKKNIFTQQTNKLNFKSVNVTCEIGIGNWENIIKKIARVQHIKSISAPSNTLSYKAIFMLPGWEPG